MYGLDFELQLYKCGDCDAGYIGKYGLLSHMKNHDGLKYFCNGCEYKKRDKSNLKKQRYYKYVTNVTKYHTKQQIGLKKYREPKHGGVIYLCYKCEY